MIPRFLANENFPAPSVALLRTHGFDVWSVAECDRGVSDSDVLQRALADQRWITFDRDYGEMAFRHRLPMPPAIVLFRLLDYAPTEPALRLLALLSEGVAAAGGFIVVTPTGQRLRPLKADR